MANQGATKHDLNEQATATAKTVQADILELKMHLLSVQMARARCRTGSG
jgi:hypothetical protein